MATETPEKYRHPLHKKLWMFKRPNSRSWWCGFHHQGKYHRASTKTDIQSEAERIAADWYLDKQVEIRTGVIPDKRRKRDIRTVKDASVLAINTLRFKVERGEKSEHYLKSVLAYLNRHILPYFETVDVKDVDAAKWADFLNHLYETKPSIANNTIHQTRNALALCLKAAANAGWITEAPRLRLESQKNKPGPRIWFEPHEQEKLIKALDDYVEEMRHTPHRKDALELRDHVLFVLYSGLRPGEIKNLRFRDIRHVTDDRGIPHVILSIMGKRGEGLCNPDRQIMPVIEAIRKRRKPESPDERLFLKYHNDAFNKVLKNSGLKFDDRGRKRDFYSLRHTYISNKIREGVPVFDIARNCRTSTTMIDNHYARYLSPELLTSLHKKSDEQIEKILERQRERDSLLKRLAELESEMGKEILTKGDWNIPLEDMLEMDEADERARGIEQDIQALAKKYGLSASQIREMVSKG